MDCCFYETSLELQFQTLDIKIPTPPTRLIRWLRLIMAAVLSGALHSVIGGWFCTALWLISWWKLQFLKYLGTMEGDPLGLPLHSFIYSWLSATFFSQALHPCFFPAQPALFSPHPLFFKKIPIFQSQPSEKDSDWQEATVLLQHLAFPWTTWFSLSHPPQLFCHAHPAWRSVCAAPSGILAEGGLAIPVLLSFPLPSFSFH